MPLAFDAVLVAALAQELEQRLEGARLRALRLDRPGRSLSLLFREGTLRFALHPATGGVTWHDPTEPEPGDRPLAGRVKQARALTDDRVLRLTVLKSRGSPPAVDVVIEWVTGRWNAVVVENPEQGEGIVRHVLVELDGDRAPRVGYPWTPPPLSQREGADGEVTLERWTERLLAVEAGLRRRALLATYAWTSPLNADAILGAAAREDGSAGERALADGHARWRELVEVALARRASAPVLMRTTAGGLQPYPLPLASADEESVPTLLDGFARGAGDLAAASPIPKGLIDALRERGVHAWARVESLQRELAEAPDPVALRGTGDLILARIGEVVRGRDSVSLIDFEGVAVDVALDSKLPPNENASRYYERAARAERARERLPAMVSKAEKEARRLDALVGAASRGELSAEAVRAELPAVAEESERETAPSLPYRTYRSSGGIEIRVGRGAKHNDDLTFHHAAPDDVWLHARHAAGAHVVLRWTGEGNPPARDLAEAAVLAALASKARSSGTVPVDWTRRKYVRKPRKSPPGQVVVERVKTLFVEPDPAVEVRLRES